MPCWWWCASSKSQPKEVVSELILKRNEDEVLLCFALLLLYSLSLPRLFSPSLCVPRCPLPSLHKCPRRNARPFLLRRYVRPRGSLEPPPNRKLRFTRACTHLPSYRQSPPPPPPHRHDVWLTSLPPPHFTRHSKAKANTRPCKFGEDNLFTLCAVALRLASLVGCWPCCRYLSCPWRGPSADAAHMPERKGP